MLQAQDNFGYDIELVNVDGSDLFTEAFCDGNTGERVKKQQEKTDD